MHAFAYICSVVMFLEHEYNVISILSYMLCFKYSHAVCFILHCFLYMLTIYVSLCSLYIHAYTYVALAFFSFHLLLYALVTHCFMNIACDSRQVVQGLIRKAVQFVCLLLLP